MRIDDFLAGNTPASSEQQEDNKAASKILWNYTILDVSGSMADRTNSKNSDGHWVAGPSKFDSAVAGINEDIRLMRADTTGVTFVVGIVEFSGDTNYGNYYTYKVKNAHITGVNYVPGRPNGGTPLVATLGDVITDICIVKTPADPCIITVFTDGDDNTSGGSKWSKGTALKDLMADALKNHNISVKFIGTERDVDKMVTRYGIKAGDTFKYDGTSEGLTRGFKAKNEARMQYSKSYASGASVQSLNQMNFFSQPEEDKDKKPKQ